MNHDKEFEYLCVDDFLGDIIYTRALTTAFETGLIDALIRSKSLLYQSLMEKKGEDNRGMRLLLDLLQVNRIIDNCDGAISLTEEFVHALKFRDLLELKCALANLAAHDFLDHFSDLIYRPDQFFHEAKFFRLFSYDRCFSRSKEDYETTKRWMRITTTLTKYESLVCMKYYDFGRHKRILDIGGNSGEFVLQICRKYPELQAAVFDLPLVCDIAEEHIQCEAESKRISFAQGNALNDTLPGGFDLITFKSMLHDWPEKEAAQFIKNASQSLTPGGVLLIFERESIAALRESLSYSMLPFLLFTHFFRLPTFYEKQLEGLDFQDITVTKISLDTQFFIVMAKKKL